MKIVSIGHVAVVIASVVALGGCGGTGDSASGSGARVPLAVYATVGMGSYTRYEVRFLSIGVWDSTEMRYRLATPPETIDIAAPGGPVYLASTDVPSGSYSAFDASIEILAIDEGFGPTTYDPARSVRILKTRIAGLAGVPNVGSDGARITLDFASCGAGGLITIRNGLGCSGAHAQIGPR